MTKMTRVTFLSMATLAAAVVGFWGCGGDSASPTAASPWQPRAVSTSGTLSATIVDALNETFQDENRAETIYLGVLEDFGNVRPFANIVNAETRHSESVARILRNHGLDVPASLWTLSNVPHFSSLAEACAAAASAERENVALYDRYLALDLPLDVQTVFENNRAASLERHLPAFQTCSCQTCPRS